jgi:hypothetical protein
LRSSITTIPIDHDELANTYPARVGRLNRRSSGDSLLARAPPHASRLHARRGGRARAPSRCGGARPLRRALPVARKSRSGNKEMEFSDTCW